MSNFLKDKGLTIPVTIAYAAFIAGLGFLWSNISNVGTVNAKNTTDIASIVATQDANYKSIDSRLGNLEKGQDKVITILLQRK